VPIDMQARAQELERACYEVVSAAELAELRARHAAEPRLQRISGIHDIETVRALGELGVTGDTIFAFELVPLIEVAWADGAMQAKERDAILRAAAARGIAPDSPRGRVLRGWLEKRPTRALITAWTSYISALVERLTAKQRKTLTAQMIERAGEIARAAGGFLGLSSISEAEENKLDQLESAFKFPEQFARLFDADH
jgi:uncharacterized tellurite resistance protein B-like protein